MLFRLKTRLIFGINLNINTLMHNVNDTVTNLFKFYLAQFSHSFKLSLLFGAITI